MISGWSLWLKRSTLHYSTTATATSSPFPWARSFPSGRPWLESTRGLTSPIPWSWFSWGVDLASFLPQEAARPWSERSVSCSTGAQPGTHSLATPSEWTRIHRWRRKLPWVAVFWHQKCPPTPLFCEPTCVPHPRRDLQLAHLCCPVPSDTLPFMRNHSDLDFPSSHRAPDLCFQTQRQAEGDARKGTEGRRGP